MRVTILGCSVRIVGNERRKRPVAHPPPGMILNNLQGASPKLVHLITDEDVLQQEAAKKLHGPNEVAKQEFQELRDGPVIQVMSPAGIEITNKPVDVDIVFEKSSEGAAPNMNSLKITYLKFIRIDITDRIRPYVAGTRIAAKDVSFPRGNHSLSVYIEDAQGKISTKLLSVKVQ